MNLHTVPLILFTPAYAHYLSVMAGRATFMFLYLVVLLRLLGKRQLGQLNIFDLAAIMGVANAVQNGITMGSGNLSVGIDAALILLLICRISAAIVARSPLLEAKISGTPTILVRDGQMIEQSMRRELISQEILEAVLRQHGLMKAEQVKLAVLEVDGAISIIPAEKHKSASA